MISGNFQVELTSVVEEIWAANLQREVRQLQVMYRWSQVAD